MGTDLNPTENTFGGDPEKMSNAGQNVSLIGHLRPKPCHRRVPRLYPVPIGFNAFLFGKEGVSN